MSDAQRPATGRSLDAMLTDAWQRLMRGVADSKSPARHPVLASQGVAGGGEARTVVLRGASQSDGIVEMHTDGASEKAAELCEEPRATVHVWDPRARLQIRLRVTVSQVAGDREAWDRVPPASRHAYGAAPPPGHPIPAPGRVEANPDPDRFVRLIGRIDEIDLLHLGEPHRRARYRRDEGWAGTWLAP